MPMKKPKQHLIAEVPRRDSKVGMTIGIDLGDVWSHYCAGWRSLAAIVCQPRPRSASRSDAWPCCRQVWLWRLARCSNRLPR